MDRTRRGSGPERGPAVDDEGVPGDPRGGVASTGTAAALAMSSGSPRRRSGSAGATASSSASHSARAMSVFTSPGAMALTRTPGASSLASVLGEVDDRGLGHVVAADATARPTRPPTDAMLMTDAAVLGHRAPARRPGSRRGAPPGSPRTVLSSAAGRCRWSGPCRGWWRRCSPGCRARRTARRWRPRRPRPARGRRRWPRTRRRSPPVPAGAISSRPPRARRPCATTSITDAPPAAAYAAAMALPMPRDAPVTSATFPSSRSSMAAAP